MNSQEAINENFIPYPYNFPAIKFIVSEEPMPETIVHKVIPPIAHYPNWAFHCPDCEPKDSYFELPQDLPEIKELHEKGELPFNRSCGCKENNIHPETLRLRDVL